MLQVTPELVVRKRARSLSGEEEPVQSKSKQARMELKIDTLLNEMGKLRESVATKEDLGAVRKKVENMESKQAAMSASQSEIKKRLEGLERGAKSRGNPGGRSEFGNAKETEAFIDARRSLILSPTMPTLPNVKDFLLNEMKIPFDLMADLQISNIRKIHPRRLPAHRAKQDESKRVAIMLRDAHERDVVISYAAYLSREARIDIVVPDYLLSLKSQFDTLSYRLRKHVKLTADKNVQTSLRLDDRSQGLQMAVRMSRDEQWLHYSIKELRELENKLMESSDAGEEEDEEECC